MAERRKRSGATGTLREVDSSLVLRTAVATCSGLLLGSAIHAQEPSAVREDGWFTVVEYGSVPSEFSPPLRLALLDETEIMRFRLAGREARGDLYQVLIEPFTLGTLLFETYKLPPAEKSDAEQDLRTVAMKEPYIVRCLYRASSGTHFERYLWYGTPPAEAHPTRWQGNPDGHPLSRVEAPRSTCPLHYDGP